MPLYFYLFTFSYIPMQDVAPRAVRMADATEAMICTTHLMVSFFVIRVSFFYFGTDYTDFHCFLFSRVSQREPCESVPN